MANETGAERFYPCKVCSGDLDKPCKHILGSPHRLVSRLCALESEVRELKAQVQRLQTFKNSVDIAVTAGLLGMSGELGFKLPCHEFVTSMKVAFRQAEEEYMRGGAR